MAKLTKQLKEVWAEDTKQELTGYETDPEIMYMDKIAHLHIVSIPEEDVLEGTEEKYVVKVNMMQKNFYYNPTTGNLYLDYYDHEAGQKALDSLLEKIEDMSEDDAKEAIKGKYVQHIKRKLVVFKTGSGELSDKVKELID